MHTQSSTVYEMLDTHPTLGKIRGLMYIYGGHINFKVVDRGSIDHLALCLDDNHRELVPIDFKRVRQGNKYSGKIAVRIIARNGAPQAVETYQQRLESLTNHAYAMINDVIITHSSRNRAQ